MTWQDLADGARAPWQALAPDLAIETEPPAEPVLPRDEGLRTQLLSGLMADGYYRHGPVVPAARIAAMAALVSRLRAARLPLELAFAFDPFWQLANWFRPALEWVLGRDFLQLPALTIWHVDRQDDAGWPPHRDRHGTIGDDGRPRALTVWLPLTDATPDNGCIHVLPRSLDPDHGEQDFPDTISRRDLQNVLALPARAGAFFCWTQELVHWGGRYTDHATGPRISIGIELQRADVPPYRAPAWNPRALPPFTRRLGLIGDAILEYQRMRITPDDHLALARSLVRFLERPQP